MCNISRPLKELTCLANESPAVDDERDRVAHNPKVRHKGNNGNPSDRHEHDAIAGRPVGRAAVDAEVTAIQDDHGDDVEEGELIVCVCVLCSGEVCGRGKKRTEGGGGGRSVTRCVEWEDDM